MPDDAFSKALKEMDEISITVKGRRSGRKITLPVWFVLEGHTLWLLPVGGSRTQWFRNLLADPTITVRAGRQRHTLTARPTRGPKTVGAVVRKFRARYTPGEIRRYYTVFDAAVKIPLAA
ncbi:MAG: nitroreductase family deazaflavin-dependent oxidoreductase [Armatimonadetes bacterium]|nr:nitroreductase family deazaflavin-dependent oxidoreductase [Armatimonadota bacterium]